MGVFTHAQTVDTRPLLPPPTWPGYEANKGYKYYDLQREEGEVFWKCKFHKAGCNGRATSHEVVDVTWTEHNHPPDQASNKAKKLVSSTRKVQCSFSDF